MIKLQFLLTQWQEVNELLKNRLIHLAEEADTLIKEEQDLINKLQKTAQAKKAMQKQNVLDRMNIDFGWKYTA